MLKPRCAVGTRSKNNCKNKGMRSIFLAYLLLIYSVIIRKYILGEYFMKKRIIALVLSLCMLSAFAGCGSKTTTDKYFKYPISSDPVCIDPQIAFNTFALMTIESCMEGLVRSDKNGNILPGVAKRWDVSENGLVYTFHLRKDAVWYVPDKLKKQLGDDFDTSIKADDFLFALRRAIDPATGAPEAKKLYAVRNAEKIARGEAQINELGVKAVDSYTLQITLEYATPDFLSALTSAVAMPCSSEFFTYTGGRYGLDSDMFLSNGPFYLSKWTHDTSLFLRRNESYHGDNTAVPSTLSLYVNTDEQSIINSFVEGTYDAIPISAKNLGQVKREGMGLRSCADSTWLLGFNQAEPVLANEKIRSALLRAINIRGLSNQGFKADADGIVPPALMLGGKSFRQAVGSVPKPVFNPDDAAALLSEGLEELELKKLDGLTLLCPDELEIKRMMGYMIQDWQENLNVYINLEAVPFEEIRARMFSGDYKLAYFPMDSGTDSAADYFRRFTGGDVRNVLGYDNEDFNMLVNEIDTCVSPAQRTAIFRQAEAALIDRSVVYPFAFEETYYVTGKGVSGIDFYPYGGKVSFTKAEKQE